MFFCPEAKTSLDVVQFLVQENPNIAYFTFCSYKMPSPQETVNEAGDLIKTLICHKENDDFSPLSAHNITKHGLIEMCEALPSDRCLALRSRAKTLDGENLFFPLIDFSLPRTDTDLAKLTIIRDLLTQIHQLYQYKGSAFLLKTRKSYHYYGTSPLRKESWLRLLGLFLLLHPRNEDCKTSLELGFSTIIDARFIGHALLAGQGSLRISPDAHTGFPKVVAEIKPII